MELRSNRSRSKSRTSIDKEVFEGGNHMGIGQTIIRTTRSTTIKTTTSSDTDNITNINHSLDSHSINPVKMKNEKSIRKSRYKTSDYSSEDGDNQVSSTYTNDQNSKNQFLENIRRSVSRSSGSHVSALDYYRAAGDYWNKCPKTDYTYSPHSKDRTEIAPGVVAMPNMSRRSLHSYNSDTEYMVTHKQTSTESLEQEEVDYSANSSYNSKLTSNFNSDNLIRARPRSLFSNNFEDKYVYSLSSRTSAVKRKSLLRRVISTFTSIFLTIFTWITSLCYYVYKKQNTMFIWMGKKMHQTTTRIMLWDTWLLLSSNSKRKLSSLLALCIIPLVLLGGWWLLSGLGPLLYGTYFNSSSAVLPSTPLIIAATEKDSNNVHNNYQIDEHDNIIQTSFSGSEITNVQARREEKLITMNEKVILEPPTANEIAAELTSEQLEEIANSIKYSFEYLYNTDTLITKILQNPPIQTIINNYNKLILEVDERRKQNEELLAEDTSQRQQLIINNLKEEINKVKLDLMQLEKSHNDEIVNIIAQLRSENAQSSAQLHYQLNRCCRHSLVNMESYIMKILKDLLGAPHYLSTQQDISNWLHATFIAKQDLDMHLANVTKHLKENYDSLIENSESVIMDKVLLKISAELNNRIEKVQKIQAQENVRELRIDSLTDEHIKKIVRDSIALYDADKTGLVDYALESAGGHILSTRCTESYQARTAVLSIFGIPLWYPTNTPRTVITPGMTPGECWAFQNFPGFLLVKLAAPIKIEAFSLEHISRMLAPNRKIDSAPKEFSVYGLRNETDKEPVLLGKYLYDWNEPPLQYFAAEVHGLIFDIIELRIHSNHGNPNYTCLYRFRVHGSLSAEPT